MRINKEGNTMPTNPMTPTPVISARDRLVAAYGTRRHEFDRILAVCDYEYDRAWAIFASRVCPELLGGYRGYVEDVADAARLAIKYAERAKHRIATHFECALIERVGA
jgi:hypothetical protein